MYDFCTYFPRNPPSAPADKTKHFSDLLSYTERMNTSRLSIVYAMKVDSVSVAAFDDPVDGSMTYQTSVSIGVGALADLAAHVAERQLGTNDRITVIFEPEEPENLLPVGTPQQALPDPLAPGARAQRKAMKPRGAV